jgi:hypothetical protein
VLQCSNRAGTSLELLSVGVSIAYAKNLEQVPLEGSA